MSDLATALRIGTIHRVLRGQEDLLIFFFHHKEIELRLPPDELRAEALTDLNDDDRLLINVAVDLWTGERKVKLGDVIGDLEFESLLGLIKGVLHHCGVDPQDLEEPLC
jgi:hypothetical protein